MSISSKQLKTSKDVKQFWGDPFGRSKLNYAKRPAHDLSDFVAFCFHLCYEVVAKNAELLAPGITLGVFAVRAQFLDVLQAYAEGNTDGTVDVEPVSFSLLEGDDPWLGLSWSVMPVVLHSISFALTTTGPENWTYPVLLDRSTIKPAGPPFASELDRYRRLNNASFAVVKLWQTASWCRRAGLNDTSRILQCTIDAVGDEHGDVELLARMVELLREVQDSARRSSITRALSAK